MKPSKLRWSPNSTSAVLHLSATMEDIGDTLTSNLSVLPVGSQDMKDLLLKFWQYVVHFVKPTYNPHSLSHFTEGSISSQVVSRWCRDRLFTPDKSGGFTFPAYFLRSNTAFSWGVVKSSPRVWIWKYRYFKWDVRLHLDGFGVFIFFYTILPSFQNLKRHICKIQRKPMEIWWKIQILQNVSYSPVAKIKIQFESLHFNAWFKEINWFSNLIVTRIIIESDPMILIEIKVGFILKC